jgi:hypothetical protein
MCLLLKTADKLIAGHRNPWADWVRYWYAPGHRLAPTAAWSMFQRLVVTYRGLTIVNVSAGESTSFLFDSWSTAGPLATTLPTLFSHCVDPAVFVAAALHTGELVLPLRNRLNSVAAADLAGLRLGHAPDTRPLRWGPEKRFRAGAVYRMLKQTGCSVPLAEANWANFAPVKVRVFFWVLCHGNTRTRNFLHRHGVLDTGCCPYCLDTPEDVGHLFFRCPRTTVFWLHVCPGTPPIPLRSSGGASLSPPANYATLLRSSSSGSSGRAVIG